MAQQPPDDALPQLVDALVASYRSDPRASHINRRFLPSRPEIVDVLALLLQLFYPGYFGRQDLTDENVAYHVGVALSTVREKLARQIEQCLCYADERRASTASVDVGRCCARGDLLATRFLARLPELRRALIGDVQAAFDGDPAAIDLDEVILAYPGLLAVTVYRVAHELHAMGVPLMPRIMTEWAHTQTGADIHPGASIGPRFFLDHATGAVIGETSVLGADVRLYQGVTLGARSLPRDAAGRVVRGAPGQRHPTVEDGATLYANATVLGGETVVGAGSVVGGGVFLTRSVPPGARVGMVPPELRVEPQEESAPEAF